MKYYIIAKNPGENLRENLDEIGIYDVENLDDFMGYMNHIIEPGRSLDDYEYWLTKCPIEGEFLMKIMGIDTDTGSVDLTSNMLAVLDNIEGCFTIWEDVIPWPKPRSMDGPNWDPWVERGYLLEEMEEKDMDVPTLNERAIMRALNDEFDDSYDMKNVLIALQRVALTLTQTDLAWLTYLDRRSEDQFKSLFAQVKALGGEPHFRK